MPATPKKILYVEDHPPARLLMSAIVSDLTAHHLITAGTGEQAKQITSSEKPDLYILDLDLPDTDGRTLAENLLALHPAPIIFVSAYAEVIVREDLAHITSDYLAKPLDPDHVAEVIERSLG